MQFQTQFVRFRTEDKRPVPIAFPVQVIAPDAEQAMGKLKHLADAGRWPTLADAVRLFGDGAEIDSFIRAPNHA